jgi:hypothetical protein
MKTKSIHYRILTYKVRQKNPYVSDLEILKNSGIQKGYHLKLTMFGRTTSRILEQIPGKSVKLA